MGAEKVHKRATTGVRGSAAAKVPIVLPKGKEMPSGKAVLMVKLAGNSYFVKKSRSERGPGYAFTFLLALAWKFEAVSDALEVARRISQSRHPGLTEVRLKPYSKE